MYIIIGIIFAILTCLFLLYLTTSAKNKNFKKGDGSLTESWSKIFYSFEDSCDLRIALLTIFVTSVLIILFWIIIIPFAFFYYLFDRMTKKNN